MRMWQAHSWTYLQDIQLLVKGPVIYSRVFPAQQAYGENIGNIGPEDFLF